MSDTPIQSKEESAAQSNELAERLLRRATEPAGVIDTLQPRRQYERTTEWLAQRFSLLDRWKSRYVAAEDAGESTSLVFAQAKSQQPRAMMAHSGDQIFSAARSDQSASGEGALSRVARAAIVPQSPARASSPPAQLRVSKRRADAYSSKAIESATPTARSDDAVPRVAETTHNISNDKVSRSAFDKNDAPQAMASNDDEQSHSSATAKFGDHSDIRVPEISKGSIETLARHDSPSSLTVPTQLTESVVISNRVSPVRGEASAAVSPERSLARAREIRAERISSPGVPLQLQRDEKRVARSREISNPPSHTSAQVMRKASAPIVSSEQPIFSNSSESAIPSIPNEPAQEQAAFSDNAHSSIKSADSFAERSFTSKGIESAQPASTLPLARPLIQRQAATDSRAADTASSSTTRSAEVRAASAQERPTIIWRRTDRRSGTTDNASLAIAPSSGRVSVARQSAPESQTVALAASSAADMMPSVAAPSSGGADVDQLAEQVWRLISRRLEIERERR
ncbi:MAG TPA: hypothetical protein VID27_11940, partial [Blastocatellia bacterium]